MFEQSQVANKASYKTTYNDEYKKKNRFLEQNPNQYKLPDFTVNNPYDFNKLSEKLENKNNYESVNSNRFLRNNDLTSVSKSAFSNFGSVYKTPQVPAFVKRDNFFQSNSEKNIAYLHTHTGGLLPIVPNEEEKKLSIIQKLSNSSENLFGKTESQSSFTHKIPTISRARIRSHLKDDRTFHTNSEKNIGYLKTSEGALITYVPFKEDALSGYDYKNYTVIKEKPTLSEQPPYDNNHIKIKLHNPNNQVRRNGSTVGKLFGV